MKPTKDPPLWIILIGLCLFAVPQFILAQVGPQRLDLRVLLAIVLAIPGTLFMMFAFRRTS